MKQTRGTTRNSKGISMAFTVHVVPYQTTTSFAQIIYQLKGQSNLQNVDWMISISKAPAFFQ